MSTTEPEQPEQPDEPEQPEQPDEPEDIPSSHDTSGQFPADEVEATHQRDE